MTMIEWVLFLVLALGAVVSALLVVLPPLARNPLRAAIALIVSLCAVAGLYLLLAAHLVAVLQVLVYVGAVMVLFLFVIMLLNLSPEELGGARVTFAKLLSVAAVAALVGRLGWLLWRDPPLEQAADLTSRADFGWVAPVARLLFTDYLVPFEVLSVFLLVAVMGAVVLARREF
jgi:NADH-quinone oxidoreductase subunit J